MRLFLQTQHDCLEGWLLARQDARRRRAEVTYQYFLGAESMRRLGEQLARGIELYQSRRSNTHRGTSCNNRSKDNLYFLMSLKVNVQIINNAYRTRKHVCPQEPNSLT